MIIVKGAIPVKNTHRDEALTLIEALADVSRAEPGCLSYEVYLRADAPEVIVIWQQWVSVGALEAHFDSDHVDAFLDAIPELIDGQVSSERFDVEAVTYEEEDTELLDIPHVTYLDGIILH